jgi:hypothetical protein
MTDRELVLRTWTVADHPPLTDYLRGELDRLANGPSMAIWLQRATRRNFGVPHEAIMEAIRECRDRDDE